MATKLNLSKAENLQLAEYLAFKHLLEQVDQLKARVSELEARQDR